MDQDTIAQACATLKSTMRTLQLATVDEEGVPHCGYTPFITDQYELIIFVSQLALHTRDMLSNGQAGIMLIADEQDSTQIFARSRLSLQVRVKPVAPDHAQYNQLLDAYEAKHGKMVGLLRTLPDFVLMRLTPISGQFVMGFGKAYRLEGEHLDKFVHARTA
jgi:putative heme iron utilization protein